MFDRYFPGKMVIFMGKQFVFSGGYLPEGRWGWMSRVLIVQEGRVGSFIVMSSWRYVETQVPYFLRQ